MATYDGLRMMNQGKQGFFGGSPVFMGGEKDPVSTYQFGPQPESPEMKLAREQAERAQAEAERNRQFQGQQNEADRQAQLAPFTYRQQLTERLLPTILGGLGGTGSQVGGTIAPQPAFTASPVYTDQQMNQQVNAAVGQNDARTATQQRLLGQSAAGRGFGAASPATAALSRSIDTAGMRENATAEREIPFQAAQANNDSMFRGSQLMQQAWRDREDSDIRRRQQNISSVTSLLGLLGG